MAVTIYPILKSGGFGGDVVRQSVPKDPATVLKQGDLITVDNNKLAIRAVAASATLAYVLADAPVGAESVAVNSNPFTQYVMQADQNSVATDRGNEVDLVEDVDGNQLVDLGASTTDVFKVMNTVDGVEVGTRTVIVKINKLLTL
jgi:hypothetical protein